MKYRHISLLIIVSIFICLGCSNNKEVLKSDYVDITYNPYKLGQRAKENLGEEGIKFYSEVLIPSVLNRDKEIQVPSTISDEEKSLIVNYFQQNSLLEYFAGTPFFDEDGDTIIFDYSNCINMTDTEYEQAIDEMGNCVENILNNNVKQNYNYFERVLVLYEYLAQNITYNKDTISTNAYGVLVNKEGTCCGFAQSLQILLSQLDEDEGYQEEWLSNDDREGHVWNVILIDKEWYYFDITWENSEDSGKGLKYFAMDIERREYSGLLRDVYNMSPLSLNIPVIISDNNRFSILNNCIEYKLDLDNHKVKIKNSNDNKWYILNTVNYRLKEINTSYE